MEVKVTALLRFVSFGDYRVTHRTEVRWKPEGPWLDLGCRVVGHSEFALLTYMLAAGARALNIAFIYEDWTVRGGQQAPTETQSLEDKIQESLKDFINA